MYGTADDPMIAVPSHKVRNVGAFKFYYVQCAIRAKQRNVMLIERTDVAPVSNPNISSAE